MHKVGDVCHLHAKSTVEVTIYIGAGIRLCSVGKTHWHAWF
jgi:hypothetical protein